MSSIRKFRLCEIGYALADVPLPLMTFETQNNQLQSSMLSVSFRSAVGLNAIANEHGRTGSDSRPLLSCNAMTDGPAGWESVTQ